jgi:cytochrome c
MDSLNGLLAVALLLSATASVPVLGLAEEASNGMINSSPIADETRLVSFVESAVAYARDNGRDTALKQFSNKTGPFVRGDLYIYAYDFNGTNIAHPFKTAWIGQNKLNETDSNGVLYIRDLISVARAGRGFTYFIFL